MVYTEYYLMGFNQFMLLDSPADSTVKHIGQTGGLRSVNFRERQVQVEYDGFEGAALLFEFAWAPGGGLGTVCCVSFMHLSKQMFHRGREPASRGGKLYRCAAGQCLWVSDISLTNLIIITM